MLINERSSGQRPSAASPRSNLETHSWCATSRRYCSTADSDQRSVFGLDGKMSKDDALRVPFGKTANARRVIPLTPRASAVIEMRRAAARSGGLGLPLRDQERTHRKIDFEETTPEGGKLAKLVPFPLYTFRHTCLTRWAAYMDPYTLAYLAGHSDFSTTKRYVHPQAHTVRQAMERARNGQGGHTSGHTTEVQTERQAPTSAVIQ